MRNTRLAAVLRARTGAGMIINLCDTNGGTTLPNEMQQIVPDLRVALPCGSASIRNDCEMAVANTAVAVQAGAKWCRGTINGVGERCGNTNRNRSFR